MWPTKLFYSCSFHHDSAIQKVHLDRPHYENDQVVAPASAQVTHKGEPRTLTMLQALANIYKT